MRFMSNSNVKDAYDSFMSLVKKGVVSRDEFRDVEAKAAFVPLILYEECMYLRQLVAQAEGHEEERIAFGEFYSWLKETKDMIATYTDMEVCHALQPGDPDDLPMKVLVQRVLKNREAFLEIGMEHVMNQNMHDEVPEDMEMLSTLREVARTGLRFGLEPHSSLLEAIRVVQEVIDLKSSGNYDHAQSQKLMERAQQCSGEWMKWMHDLEKRNP